MFVKAEVPDVPVPKRRMALGVKPNPVIWASLKGNPVVTPDLENDPTFQFNTKFKSQRFRNKTKDNGTSKS